jgi:hypothetical protein
MSSIFTIIDAVITDDDGNTSAINGIPTYHTKTFGRYRANYPYMAAKKGLTSTYKHFAKYPDWFPNYDRNNPPQIILVLKHLNTGKLYAYLGTRTKMSGEPVTIVGSYGRTRVYRWINRVQAVDLESVGWGGGGHLPLNPLA